MILIAVVGIVILVLVFLIVKWINLPKVIEQRRKQAEEAEERRQERREDSEERRQKRREEWNNRDGIFGWRKRRQEAKPVEPEKPEVKPETEVNPEQDEDTSPELNPKDPEILNPDSEIVQPAQPEPRRRLFPRLFNRRK